MLYEYASHWARLCPIFAQDGGANNKNSKEANEFFAEKFEAWFHEFDPEGGNRQVKSFMRTMAMKSFGSVRNKIVKKVGQREEASKGE